MFLPVNYCRLRVVAYMNQSGNNCKEAQHIHPLHFYLLLQVTHPFKLFTLIFFPKLPRKSRCLTYHPKRQQALAVFHIGGILLKEMKANGIFKVYKPGIKWEPKMLETNLVLKAVLLSSANFILKIQ